MELFQHNIKKYISTFINYNMTSNIETDWLTDGF